MLDQPATSAASTLSEGDLAGFTGTTQWFRHPTVQSVLYTEGIQYLAEQGKCYWLIDEIAFAQHIPEVARKQFQQWTLKVEENRSAILTCDDGNLKIVFTKRIDYTDFPLKQIQLFFSDNVLLLPSEW